MEIYLTRQQAEAIRNDYSWIVGRSFEIYGRTMTVKGINLEQIRESEYWHIIVVFEAISTTPPTSPIGIFLREVMIPFDPRKYVDLREEAKAS